MSNILGYPIFAAWFGFPLFETETRFYFLMLDVLD